MLDFLTRMFVVVDVDYLVREIVPSAILRLEKLVEVKDRRIDNNEILRNKVADEITADTSERERALHVINQLTHIIGKQT